MVVISTSHHCNPGSILGLYVGCDWLISIWLQGCFSGFLSFRPSTKINFPAKMCRRVYWSRASGSGDWVTTPNITAFPHSDSRVSSVYHSPGKTLSLRWVHRWVLLTLKWLWQVWGYPGLRLLMGRSSVHICDNKQEHKNKSHKWY